MEHVTGPSELGLFCVALRPCTAGVLGTVLPGSSAHVWIRMHWPEPTLKWWQARLLLSVRGKPTTVTVRRLAFDLQLPATRFLELLPEFEDKGLDLYLMTHPVPDTLTLEGLEHSAAYRVLLANGLIAHFYLPHGHEVAVLSSPSRDILEAWLKGPLRNWLQEGGDAA